MKVKTARTMNIDKRIFRDYDIRGIAGVKFEPRVVEEYEKWYGPFPGITINLETSNAIGRAYGSRIRQLGGKKVVVGYEIRPYADELKNAFVEGITETGVSVADAGKTTTPLIYFLNSHLGFDGGVNITGSHNVYFYNGFKIMKKDCWPLFGEELQMLYQMIIDDDYDLAEEKGKVEKLENGYEIYKEYLLRKIKLRKKPKVVIDCGNGTPGLFAVDLFESLGCRVEGMYLEPDAYFPNHTPDPEQPFNLKDLMAKVRETGAELGIAFDADGDRCGVVDENGKLIFPDELLLLFAKQYLPKNQGKKVLFEVKCSQLLEELIPKMGGVPLMHRTGHAPIKDSMRRDLDIVLGGEVSGHFWFGDHYRIDDGFYSAAYLLKLYSEHDGPFSSMFSFIPKRVRTPEIKLPCQDEIKHRVVEDLAKHFAANYKTITIDGARVMFDEKSWGLVRASNTSPYLTIRLEALTEARLLEIKNILADELEKYKEIGDKLDRDHVYSHTGKLGYL